jgi:hypothetical protein
MVREIAGVPVDGRSDSAAIAPARDAPWRAIESSL